MALYDSISFPNLPDRPYTYINMVSTVDGKAVSPDDEHPLFGAPNDRPNMLALRAHADALIYGATTGKDVPPEEFLDPEFQAKREAAGRDPLMKYVLFSHGGHLTDDDKIFGQAELKPIVYVPEGVDLKLKNADVRQSGKGELDLPTIMKELKLEDEIDVALCEGGPTTNQPFFTFGLVDEFFLTVAPKVFGGKPIRTVVEGDLIPADHGQLEVISAEHEGDEVFLRYRVQNPV